MDVQPKPGSSVHSGTTHRAPWISFAGNTIGGIHKWCHTNFDNFDPPIPTVMHLCPKPYALVSKNTLPPGPPSWRNIIYSQLSRSSTARGSCTRQVTEKVGLGQDLKCAFVCSLYWWIRYRASFLSFFLLDLKLGVPVIEVKTSCFKLISFYCLQVLEFCVLWIKHIL